MGDEEEMEELAELHKRLPQLNLREKRQRVKEMDEHIAVHERHMKTFECIKEKRLHDFEESLKTIYKMIEDDKTLFEEESKSNLKMIATIKKLTDEMRDIKSEFDKTEKIFNNLETCKKILLTPELQEPQQAEALKGQVPSQDEQSQPQESEVRQGLDSSPDRVLSSTMESTVSVALNDTLDKNSKVDRDSSEYEEKLVLYMSDSQQPLDLATVLKDQCLSVMENSARVDAKLKEVQQKINTATNKIKVEQEKVIVWENDKTKSRNKELVDTDWLKRMVQLHESLKTEDKDILLGALGKKIKQIHVSCVDSWLTHLSTLENLTNIEYHMCSLLDLVESIPADRLKIQRQIKEKERQHEENLRLEEEKQRERSKKCSQRSLSNIKKNTRKLMPRSIPMEKQKIQVHDEADVALEDELNAYYFNLSDSEDSD